MTATSPDSAGAQEQLRKLEELLELLEKAGHQVPDYLTKSVKALRISVDTGVDLGNAAARASAALAQYTNQVNQACEDDGVCLASELHLYQQRNVHFTLNWNNPDSVVRNFVRATLQRYLPQRICERLDACKSR